MASLIAQIEERVEVAHHKSTLLKDVKQYDRIKFELKSTCVRALGPVSPNIYFFGSRTTGVAREKSDLDIFICFDSKFYGDLDRVLDGARLTTIHDNLGEQWKINSFLPKASCPVLRAKYKPLNLDCDIVVSNGLGVKNSEIIDHLFNIQPQSRYFFHFIRMWLENSELVIRGYPLALLVIFFLQNRNLMPSIKTVQSKLTAKTIDGWNVVFNEQGTLASYGVKEMINYRDHLNDFFAFYERYDFDDYVISIHLGKAISRRGYDQPKIKIDDPLCLVGPIKLDYNCAHDIEFGHLSLLKNICCDAVFVIRAPKKA